MNLTFVAVASAVLPFVVSAIAKTTWSSQRKRLAQLVVAALFAAVPRGTNAGRGANTKGSSNIITNGSRIVVPEG